MNIAILGCGNVGGTLGQRWAKAGHNVVFGSRDPKTQKIRDLVKQAGETARASTVEAAIDAAEVVVAALPWPDGYVLLRRRRRIRQSCRTASRFGTRI